jgi:thiosulfate dehydrogenase
MGPARPAAPLASALLASALLALAPRIGAETTARNLAPFAPPAESAMPGGPLGDSIRLGQKVLTQTQQHAKAYVGNGLNCTSCHLDGGRVQHAVPWVGLWAVFPEYRSRNAQVNALEERINDCFRRSLNGKPLPYDSPEMVGVLAYIWWLSQGVPTGMEVEGRGFQRIQLPAGQKPDPENGKAIYAAKCASCHGQDGQGITGPNGAYLFPAVWGPKSFNIGAGMARLNNAAAFVKANMPLGQGNTLTDQEAFDVAAYFTQQPRPDFAAKTQDWPKGGKPPDARY